MNEIGDLKRGLTSLESEQVPAIMEPIMKQLSLANGELETLKTKLREKAAIVDLQLLRQEVDKKALKSSILLRETCLPDKCF